MTHCNKHEMKLQVQSLLLQITQTLEQIESPDVTISDEGTGIVTHPRDLYLSCVKDVCHAMLKEEKTAEIIVSRCV